MKFTYTIQCLLMLLLVSAMDAQLKCNPCGVLHLLIFHERTNIDYAILDNSITTNLDAATLCFFARDDPEESSTSTRDNQYIYSYAVAGEDDEFNIFLAPQIGVEIHGIRRVAAVGLEDGEWHHICFTWSSANGKYQFFKDGESVGSGTGLHTGGYITSGGTTVIGQDQDTVGGGFDAAQAFVGDLTQVNVYNEVLSERVIKEQAYSCHSKKGSVNRWPQFRYNIHGGVVVVRPC